MARHVRLSPGVFSGAYLNGGRYAAGLEAGRRLIMLLPSYYFGYLWCAMNAVGLDQIEEARDLIRQARRVQPDLSIALVRRSLSAMAPDVDRRLTESLRRAGLE